MIVIISISNDGDHLSWEAAGVSSWHCPWFPWYIEHSLSLLFLKTPRKNFNIDQKKYRQICWFSSPLVFLLKEIWCLDFWSLQLTGKKLSCNAAGLPWYEKEGQARHFFNWMLSEGSKNPVQATRRWGEEQLVNYMSVGCKNPSWACAPSPALPIINSLKYWAHSMIFSFKKSLWQSKHLKSQLVLCVSDVTFFGPGRLLEISYDEVFVC